MKNTSLVVPGALAHCNAVLPALPAKSKMAARGAKIG